MADILIKGMKMPENCEDCQIATVGSFGTWCPLKKCSIKQGYSFKDCPLVALPEHGRLIDADALQQPQSNWHTGLPTETGEYLVCIRYDLGKTVYTTGNFVEPFNLHTGWYNLKPPSGMSADEWCRKNGIKVIAWQKIEPYKEVT